MNNKDKISFAANATTKEAFIYSMLYMGIFFRNVWRFINNFVHRLPWVFAALVFLACTIVSFIYIGQARAERDYYNKENYKLTQELNKYKIAAEYQTNEKLYRN